MLTLRLTDFCEQCIVLCKTADSRGHSKKCWWWSKKEKNLYSHHAIINSRVANGWALLCVQD